MAPEDFVETVEQAKIAEVKRRAYYSARNYVYIKTCVQKYGARVSFYPHNRLIKFLRTTLTFSALFNFPDGEDRVYGIQARYYGG